MKQAWVEHIRMRDVEMEECHHCKTSLGSHKAAVQDSAGNLFCCPGCRAVYSLLAEKGLLYYYTLSAKVGAHIHSPQLHESGYEPSASSASTPQRATIALEGIHCASCVWLLERLPVLCPGVLNVTVSLAQGELELCWEPTLTSLERIRTTLASLGYRPLPSYSQQDSRNESHSTSNSARKAHSRAQLIRIGIAGAAAMNIMVLAVSLYQGEFTGIEDRYSSLFRWVSFALATPVVLYCATPIYSRAIAALRSSTLHIDVPIALGIALSFGLSAINTIRGAGEIYFDSVTTILFLLLASRHLHQRAFESSRRAFTSSWSLIPATIHRETESGSLEDIPAHTLRAEMLVHVKPGERIPCDGIIETGNSSLDCSAITGESLPVAVQATRAVLAGSLNLEAPLRIRAATNAGASQLDRILARVAASSSAAPSTFITSFDMLSMIFTASALLLAGGAFFANASTSWDAATSAAIAMLTVTCPCAVALALPLLSIRALGACARRGILVASAQVFENLPKVTSAFFDKTGTLTQGHLEVSKVHCRGSYTPDQLVELVNHLSQVNSSHPISQALVQWAQKHRDGDATSTLSVTTMQAIPSKGVRLTFVDAKEAAKTPRVASLSSLAHFTEHRQSNNGMPTFSPASSVSVLEIDSKPVAFFELQDTIHPLAHMLLSHFGSRATIGILSGDRPEAVYSVAHQFPATPSLYRGDLSPDGKAELIQATQGTSLFVGDGANDAPALLAATVGVALRGGIQSLLECADAYITRGGIEQVITLDEVALNYRRTSRTIITLGLAYNCAGICAAMLGYITPLVAAVAMPVFSTIVVSIAYAAGTRMKWDLPLFHNSRRLRQARYKSSRLSQTSPGA